MIKIGQRVKEKKFGGNLRSEGTVVSFGEEYEGMYKIVWDKEAESDIYSPTHASESEILKHADFI